MDTSALICDHEEADTHMILHLQHLSNRRFKKLLIRTVDTDVVVLAVSAIHSRDVEEVWVAFGTGKNFPYIPAHIIASKLGPQLSKALPMFHALTGSDTVSFLAGKGKITAWEVWNVFSQLTTTLASLTTTPAHVSDVDLSTIERFIVLLYCKITAQTEVNKQDKSYLPRVTKQSKTSQH